MLLVGEEDWPFPIRLVRLNNTWRFDGQAARRNLFSAASAATTAVIGIDIEKKAYAANSGRINIS